MEITRNISIGLAILIGIAMVVGCSQTDNTIKTENPVQVKTPVMTENKEASKEDTHKEQTQPSTTQTTDVREFTITAKKFSFTPSKIEVNRGDKVKLVVTSSDVPHGISIPEYGINQRLEPGKPANIEFVAEKQGTFRAFCSVFCGSGHGDMQGTIVVK